MSGPWSKGLTAMTVVVCSVLILQGCLVVRNSPAPGCVQRIGFSPMGGCFGKTAILDLEIEPEIECLSIAVNNCNGGVLEIRNQCEQALVLGGVTVEPQSRISADVVREGNRHVLVSVSSNFSQYVPQADERIDLVGVLGEQPVRVTFIKTAILCE